MSSVVQKVIEWGFYLLFFLVPLIFYSGSYELFEYNKIMLVYGLTIIIVSIWLIKLILNFKFQISNWFRSIPRTPLDLPILFYLSAHVLSTLFSIDPHTSLWGYYSRFHEGLLATISYILLYYAAVSNLNRSHVLRILLVSFVSASLVSLYGILEHFGVSPSCGFITGKWNVDCWVQDVKNRVFATLGQPNWMAAYLDVVILTSLGMGIKNYELRIKDTVKKVHFNAIIHNSHFIILPLLAAALWFTKSRSGLIGLAAGAGVFALFSLNIPSRIKLAVCALALMAAGFAGTYWWQHLPVENPGISESGAIRKPVWEGAVKIWERYPILGSGVETFAYAYYKDRPVEHNMVSEWDFLYNKAHNEYLNLLATTGTIGFLSYLSILGVFVLWFIRLLTTKNQSNHQSLITNHFLVISLFAAWVTILVTNFFGFSVVIIGLFFFLIPAFCFLLEKETPQKGDSFAKSLLTPPGNVRWFFIAFISFAALIMEWNLINMWRADKAFAYGKNLDGIQRYVDGHQYLVEAVSSNPSEPTFRDELAYNQAVLASTIFQQIQAASGSAVASLSAQQKLSVTIPQLSASTSDLITQAIDNSNKVVETSPNALTFWKTRTKIFYQLATIDSKYLLEALSAIQAAARLAPTDAKVHYNLGILFGRIGQTAQAITALEETVTMKPDYRDAYYALGLYFKEAGDIKKARDTMQQILTKIGPDPDAKKWLEVNK